MQLSIVIVNWNTTSFLNDLIESIHNYAPQFEFEIIVVDNASSDFNSEEFINKFPAVKLIANNDNKGYAAGNNQAIKICCGEYILLLNPDTQVTDHAIETLVNFMESHKDASAAGCKLVRPNGTIDCSLRSFPYPSAIAWEFIGLSKLFPQSKIFGRYRMTYFDYNIESEIDQPMGSCLIISRKALEDIGLFDEDFPIFFNEVDWLYRAKYNGYKVYYTPQATVIHYGASSTKQVDKKKMQAESYNSLIKFYKKHFYGNIFAPTYYIALLCIKISMKLKGLETNS